MDPKEPITPALTPVPADPAASPPAADTPAPVSAEAFQRVSSDMHKFKERAKAAEQALADAAAQVAADKAAQLVKDKNWEEAYKLQQKTLDEEKAAIAAEKDRVRNEVKAQAVSAAVGGFVKAAYAGHANLSAITFNEDGTLDQASVAVEAERLKTEFPEILAKPAKRGVLGGNAPARPEPKPEKTLADMRRDEYLGQFSIGIKKLLPAQVSLGGKKPE